MRREVVTGYDREPLIRVGLMTGASEARITLSEGYTDDAGEPLGAGDYTARFVDDGVVLAAKSFGPDVRAARVLRLSPNNFESCRVTVHDVTIGIDFHWQRKEAQQFQGALIIQATDDGLTIINELPLESYLVSVISSEMSASCPPELLRAHAIVSRGWLLAQLNNKTSQPDQHPQASTQATKREQPIDELIRWYDRESHRDFDVCADDHCQRYQGISKAFSQAAFDAVRDTRGRVLLYDGEICDARYSKSCGGMTEIYRAAWEDK